MVERVQPDELHDLARSWGFSLDANEQAQLLAVAEGVFQAFDLLESQQPARVEPVDAAQDPGRKPTAQEDPLNALVRLCRVRAEDAEGVLSGTRIGVKTRSRSRVSPSRAAHAFCRDTCPRRTVSSPTGSSARAARSSRSRPWTTWPSRRRRLQLVRADAEPVGRVAHVRRLVERSAAALFYEGIDVCVGADQGGSIRAPAAWCGVVGLKPTHSLVPCTGIAGIDQTFDHLPD